MKFSKPAPKPKESFLDMYIIRDTRTIYFETAENVLRDIRRLDFGKIKETPRGGYILKVSVMFDFEEVVDFLLSFKK